MELKRSKLNQKRQNHSFILKEQQEASLGSGRTSEAGQDTTLWNGSRVS